MQADRDNHQWPQDLDGVGIFVEEWNNRAASDRAETRRTPKYSVDRAWKARQANLRTAAEMNNEE